MTQVVIEYEPQPRQQVYHHAEGLDELLYGGAAGGGKSMATIMDALLYAMDYPKSRQIIFRRTYPDLQRSIVAETLKYYPKELGKYNSQAHEWRFINGSIIELAYWDNDANYMNYQGAAYDVIRWEELTQFEEKWYTYMLSRCRGITPYPRMVKSTTNPGGVGHSWVKKRFVDVGPPEQIHDVPKTDDNGVQLYHPKSGEALYNRVMFVPATIYDNQALMENDPNYLIRLMSLPDIERKQLLEGDWDTFAGQYFSEFTRSIHVVEPFTIPRDWRKYRAMDEGYSDPYVCLWIAQDSKGNAYVYREFSKNKLLTSEQIKETKRRSPVTEEYEYNVADTSFWNKAKTENITPAEIFAEYDIPLIQAKKERINGWKRLREWLHVYDALDHVTGNTYKTARLKIFSTCLKTIESIPAMVHDETHVEDVAAHPLDHIPDALRYWCMSRPMTEGKEDAWSATPEDIVRKRGNFDEDDEEEYGVVTNTFW